VKFEKHLTSVKCSLFDDALYPRS